MNGPSRSQSNSPAVTVARFRRWAEALREEGNSLGDTLLLYVSAWESDLTSSEKAISHWKRGELPGPGVRYKLVEKGETIAMFTDEGIWTYEVPTVGERPK